jgi:hypothetical protein
LRASATRFDRFLGNGMTRLAALERSVNAWIASVVS